MCFCPCPASCSVTAARRRSREFGFCRYRKVQDEIRVCCEKAMLLPCSCAVCLFNMPKVIGAEVDMHQLIEAAVSGSFHQRSLRSSSYYVNY